MIGVLGGGLTGLALSRRLDELGVEHRVFEAGDRAGGVIRSFERDGAVLEGGPQRTRLTPTIAALVRVLGLEEELVLVPRDLPLFVYRQGRLRPVPFTPGELARTDLLSAGAKLRLLLAPWGSGPDEEETVGAFLVRRFGRETYERAVGPLFGGLYGTDPFEMPARHALGSLADGGSARRLALAFVRGAMRRSAPPAATFTRGMATLVDALHARVSARVTLDAPATSLRREDGAWRLEAGGERLRCRHVVLTVPADAAARLLADAAPEASARVGSLRYNPILMTYLEGDCGLRGLGYQVAFGEELRSRGATWNASAFGRPGVHTVFLGGSRDRAIASLEDAEVGTIAAREFEAVTGCRTRVLGVHRTRIPSWDQSWRALDELALPAGLHLCANWESRPGIPARIERAHALAQPLADAYREDDPEMFDASRGSAFRQ